jgi:hypothetical protein
MSAKRADAKLRVHRFAAVHVWSGCVRMREWKLELRLLREHRLHDCEAHAGHGLQRGSDVHVRRRRVLVRERPLGLPLDHGGRPPSGHVPILVSSTPALCATHALQ